MSEKLKITASRERLERSLASPSLSSEDSIKLLVQSQLLRSPFPGTDEEFSKLVNNRSKELHNFVDMMRSASSIDGASAKDTVGEWKMKQDSDQFRVMYKEGLEGSPLHTMLVEGFADGPPDVCLCVAYEVMLFKKWWPHFSIPPFKVMVCTNLKRVRVGEDISLLRLKIPWPLSDREVVLHYITLEFPEEDFTFVLIKSVRRREEIELSKHGFTGDGIPDPDEVVRMDVVGGFALQKISSTRCYFRTVASLDLKIDFVPPSLINFISRQLIGNGYKLFQKAIVSAKNDEDYSDALKGQLYKIARGEAPSPPPSSMAVAPVSPGGSVGKWADGRLSPQVEKALGMMDQVIGLLRDRKSQKLGLSLAHSALTEESRRQGEGELKGMKSKSSPMWTGNAAGGDSGASTPVTAEKGKRRGIFSSVARLYCR